MKEGFINSSFISGILLPNKITVTAQNLHKAGYDRRNLTNGFPPRTEQFETLLMIQITGPENKIQSTFDTTYSEIGE